ncbi:unnamed protein product, partial [Meganyctiphanes norvegica]
SGVPDHSMHNPRVWQPWYMEEGGMGAGGKELPSRVHREHRARERLVLGRTQLRGSPSPEHGCSSDDEINVVDSPSPPPPYRRDLHEQSMEHDLPTGVLHFQQQHMDYDLPLDMSTKRRGSPPPDSIPVKSLREAQQHVNYMPHPARPRPSVITCLPPRYFHSPSTLHEPIDHHITTHEDPWSPSLQQRQINSPRSYLERPLPPPYSVATAALSAQRKENRQEQRVRHEDVNMGGSPPKQSSCNTTRKVVQAGPVDPEIDEHFRRSLGADYQQLFKNTQSPVQHNTDSVDDHFAKALGETWTKLQAERHDSPNVDRRKNVCNSPLRNLKPDISESQSRMKNNNNVSVKSGSQNSSEMCITSVSSARTNSSSPSPKCLIST